MLQETRIQNRIGQSLLDSDIPLAPASPERISEIIVHAKNATPEYQPSMIKIVYVTFMKYWLLQNVCLTR